MTLLWQAVHVGTAVLGVAYLAFPARVHAFGFEFLRRSPSEESGESAAPVWLYRGIGALLVFIGATGLV
ncbi:MULTISPECIES: hypothetical protein [unclassified Haloferax]|uniref:hypothetical protein n=1 Tax=unclassified Haloferax TaxID=2625095 RepID=UPI0002B1E91A|nr:MULTISPECIES: hypothetical protein [unclassified Haloferax]ELZ58177.1 hypothetical protein C460_10343 [Haloferax sp. ATCC BAA-646]ELZ62962.1 hypothetical protein C459_11720 [Haloferax sp. ATCC BAA-645]ELZ63665.1 hypothetical protein C458_15951 [Haloferax sp. ATCC BAA-644]